MLSKLSEKLASRARYKDSSAYWWHLRARALQGNPLSRSLARLRHKRLMRRCCASVPTCVHFGGKPNLPHGLSGIFISAHARIGEGCTVFHQVTIGSNTLPDSRSGGAPVIGDNVYIGCGAKIIGGIRVGNNVRIGANCVVFTDVPDNATVVCERPRIIQKQAPQNNSFISIEKFSEK